MNTVARNDLFDVFFVVWVALGLTSGIFFYFSKNAELKRQLWTPFVIGAAVLFGTFAWFMTGGASDFAYIAVPFLVIITVLNIRSVKFCDSCGKTIHNSNPFSAAKFCPKCGAKLKQ